MNLENSNCNWKALCIPRQPSFAWSALTQQSTMGMWDLVVLNGSHLTVLEQFLLCIKHKQAFCHIQHHCSFFSTLSLIQKVSIGNFRNTLNMLCHFPPIVLLKKSALLSFCVPFYLFFFPESWIIPSEQKFKLKLFFIDENCWANCSLS